jgi:hypothetical protein
MMELLCCLARINKVICSNLTANRHRMNLDKSLTTVCLGSPGQCILIMCDIHRPLCTGSSSDWAEELWARLSGATTSNNCRTTIGLLKLSGQHSIPQGSRKAGYCYSSSCNDDIKLSVQSAIWKRLDSVGSKCETDSLCPVVIFDICDNWK